MANKATVTLQGQRGHIVEGEYGTTFIQDEAPRPELDHEAIRLANRKTSAELAKKYFISREAFDAATVRPDFPPVIAQREVGRWPHSRSEYLRADDRVAQWCAGMKALAATLK
jgi:hypothetical protein